VARTELMRNAGLAYSSVERDGTYLAVAEAAIRYHAAARYDDEIRVDVWIEKVQSRALTFAYEVWRASEPVRRLATASTRLIAVDPRGGTRTLPAELIERIHDLDPTH
jgi:acyl-CoA thioester hydrolase